MQAYVITIMESPRSRLAASRCITSAEKQGLDVKTWEAFTPKKDPIKRLKELNINPEDFKERWSRPDRCMSAFLSHYSLWEHAIETQKETLILEHDAHFMMPVPDITGHNGIITLGKPSYGKFNTPTGFGIVPLQSKRYFPGAHAYVVTPSGAEKLIAASKIYACTTDVFCHLDRFPDLQEYYPWPIEARDDFTTIQNEYGVKAKHNYSDEYDII